MKRINEKKLEAFTVGTMGSMWQMSKKEMEEQKKKEDEAAAAHAFKEFVETFQDTPSPFTKVWVKAGTYDAGSRREDSREKGKIYKPTSKVDEKSAAEKAQEYAKMLASDLQKDSVPVKKKNQEKKKSNLELFKEELRQIQEEREERHKYKHMAGQQVLQQQPVVEQPVEESRESGSFDTGDPNTTNLYLGNLNPKISEQQLMEIFGRYGPLASIKIMWPRSIEEKQRGRNCGFVAYMSRKDAERALKTLNGRYIMGHEMRLGWGKSVPIMNQPIFIPPSLMGLTVPPPSSGLPFNAQPPPNEVQNLPKVNYKEYTTDEEKEAMLKVLPKSIVKVFIPTEKSVLNIIHRMIEFVIREGPMFEALIMYREIENPLFSFLFENECPAHIYYRWKLFSLLQGDTPSEWNEKEFRMFKDGPIWKPPIANFYMLGMSDDLVVDPDAPEITKGALSNAQRDRLEDIIHYLTPERSRIGDAMIFCIEHADAADEICECIAESLSNISTWATRKIARIYLISDILHNCTVKVSNASFFRKSFEKHLVDIFENLAAFHGVIESRIKAEAFKSRVLKVLSAWDEWTIYPKEFLLKLKSTFLGINCTASPINVENQKEEIVEDIDGAPLSGDEKDDEDLDGIPLDGAALLKGALLRSLPDAVPLTDEPIQKQHDDHDDSDIDGMPLDDDIDGIPLEKLKHDHLAKPNIKGGTFIPSKWETVDPEQIEAQAITTSKWETLDQPSPNKMYRRSISSNSESDTDSENEKVDKRQKLREIELKAIQYQDELECGDRDLKPGWSVTEQVQHYRKKLLKKDVHNEFVDSPLSYMNSKDSVGSDSPDSKRPHRKRSASPSQYHSGSSRSTPTLSYRSSKSSSKRRRSRSSSESPPRYQTERTPYASKSTRYESPASTSRSRRSPSPGHYRESYSSSSNQHNSPRYRSEKHKHKHKH